MKPMTVLALLTSAVAMTVGFSPAPAAWAQQKTGNGGLRAVGEEDPPERDDARPKDREEKSDPDDIRNALDNLSLVRDMKKLTKPIPPGLWQQYTNQPYFTPEMKAEKLLFFGQYEDAEKAYATLLKKKDLDPKDEGAYRRAQLSAIIHQGRDRDVERFNKALANLPADLKDSPPMLSLRAEALVMAGKAKDARALLKGYVDGVKDLKALDAAVLHNLNQYAGLLERAGNFVTAKGIYNRIADLEKGELPKDPPLQLEIITALYRQAALGGDKGLAGEAKSGKRYALLRLGQVCDTDLTYWPAFLLSAQILLESHNDEEGGKRIADTLTRNPNSVDAMYLKLNHSIENYDFEGAEAALEDIKDRSEGALAIATEGRLALKKRTPEKALESLLEAVKKDPELPEARGWLAAAYYLVNDAAKAEEQLKALTIDDRTHPVVLFEAAEVLRDARQFPLAEKLYKQAGDGAAWWAEPDAALAQLFLEVGNETEARKAYDRSYAIDPTNIRAVNQLRLLEEFMGDDKFTSITSSTFIDDDHKIPRFVIKCAKEDKVIAELALEWMEKVYPEVTGYFKHTPQFTTIIEFFPNHDQFSVRTTGLPWIGTVGACTGHVIAMDVPRGQARNMMGTFDWARVLRHEFTHTVTLSMTDNRIPHWLTEAAAVEQEQAPRDWDNCQLLASNFRSGTLFHLDTLTWGFIRPKRSNDRMLAYMESQWIYEYLVETYGQPKMLDFLDAFKQGKTESQAFKAVYGKPIDEIDKEFMVWAAKDIDKWGLPSQPLPKKEELDARLKKNPDDAEAHFQYAWLLTASPRTNNEALAHLVQAVKLDPKNTKYREFQGALLDALGRKGEAKDILLMVAAEDPKRAVAFRTLGLITMGEKDYDSAEKWFLKLQEQRPAESTSYTKLAGIYLLRKDVANAIGQLAQLQMHEQRDEKIPRQLASLYRQTGKLPEAESSAFRAVRINPYNAVNHNLLAQILMAEREKASTDDQKKECATRAALYWAYATELQPQIPDFWAGLADAKGALGDLKAAAEAAKKAVAIQPTSPAKKWIKE